MRDIRIGSRAIGENHPTYFVADISANHDGRLERAEMLIELAAEAGAEAAKFQHFRAPRIVSQEGFEKLGSQLGHQAGWKRSVWEVYQAASLPWSWTEPLAERASRAGIHFFSTPYDLEAVRMLAPLVPAFKIGSGDITWLEMIDQVAAQSKPVLMACGASTLADVARGADRVLAVNPDLCLMQCNTNYSGEESNFDSIELRVIETFRALYPEVVPGLSDHTRGPSTVLGAVALGARIIERHFTDDRERAGPDHGFSTTPVEWRQMVDRTRELERALGGRQKRIEANERETVVVQRRSIRAGRDLESGRLIERADLEVLRPAPEGSMAPFEIERVIGCRLRRSLPKGAAITWTDLEARETAGRAGV